MAYQGNFWDWARAFDNNNNNNNNGAGVDRPDEPPQSFSFAGFPVGGLFSGVPGPDGPHPYHPMHGPGHHGPGHHGPGPHGHPHGHPHGSPPPPPPGGFPFDGHGFFGGPRGFHGGPGHRGSRRGRCGGRRPSRGHEDGEPQHGPGAFDFNAFLVPLASYIQQFAQQSGEVNREVGEDEETTFTPPIDIFNTDSHYVLHVALPGAKKEDVGINWDAEKGALNIAGVIYRQGDEEFLKTLTQTERKVGVFERSVKLPPADVEEKDEVDGDAITAKLEDGVLVIRVPKLEKEWTDVKKVDIQ